MKIGHGRFDALEYRFDVVDIGHPSRLGPLLVMKGCHLNPIVLSLFHKHQRMGVLVVATSSARSQSTRRRPPIRPVVRSVVPRGISPPFSLVSVFKVLARKVSACHDRREAILSEECRVLVSLIWFESLG